MGLMVHCLGRLPTDLVRSYYIYILDFGWHEPLGDSLRQNFTRMASLAAQNDAVVIAGTDPETFTKEVVSFHSDRTYARRWEHWHLAGCRQDVGDPVLRKSYGFERVV